jgi:hypothetical protein
MNSPLDITVSSYKNAFDTEAKTVNLLTWLNSDNHKNLVDQIRATPEKTERDKLKTQLPCITPSGLFSERSKRGLITHTKLMAFDIDYKGNEHIGNFKELKRQISNIKNVAYCGVSVSGNGFWGLIPIQYPEKHESHFKALEMGFKRWGVKIDKACKDVCRLRYYSFDIEGYFNHNAKVFTELYKEPVKPQPIRQAQSNVIKPLEIAVNLIRNAPDGQKWETLNRTAYLLGGYISAGEITESEAKQTLQSAISTKPNVSDLNAAFKTIDKGLKDGQNKPIYQPIKSEPQPLNNNTEFLKQKIEVIKPTINYGAFPYYNERMKQLITFKTNPKNYKY